MKVIDVVDAYGVLLGTILRGGMSEAVEDQVDEIDHDQAKFYTAPRECLQVGRFRRPRGYVVLTHAHNPEDRHIQETGEVLIIKSGVVSLWIGRTSTPDANHTFVLKAGDMAIVLRGYHGMEVLEAAEIWEVKNGPYQADEKRFTEVIKEESGS